MTPLVMDLPHRGRTCDNIAWLRRLDSNPRHQGYGPCELPLLYSAICSLSGHGCIEYKSNDQHDDAEDSENKSDAAADQSGFCQHIAFTAACLALNQCHTGCYDSHCGKNAKKWKDDGQKTDTKCDNCAFVYGFCWFH